MRPNHDTARVFCLYLPISQDSRSRWSVQTLDWIWSSAIHLVVQVQAATTAQQTATWPARGLTIKQVPSVVLFLLLHATCITTTAGPGGTPR
jgi:hypothetical protein